MGQFTRFYGILEFTQPLAERELAILDPIVDAHQHFSITSDGRGLSIRPKNPISSSTAPTN